MTSSEREIEQSAPARPRPRTRHHRAHAGRGPAVSEFPARWIGRRVGRYRVLRLLAETSRGAMFVAEHIKLQKRVTLKMIPETCEAGTAAARRFDREARMTARIDHPHVAGAIDFGRVNGGGAFLVTQLAGSESLASRMTTGPLPWPAVCRIGSQIADALAAAHAIGVVHRDLKPGNIMLEVRDDALHARVVDFGVAHTSAGLSNEALQLSSERLRIGKLLGTPGYMAPEQILGGAIDGRSDLYALGVILWECCAGRRLWGAGTLAERRAAQLTQATPSLREACPDAPAALAALVDHLLARGIDDRPASAEVVREALRALCGASADADEITASATPDDEIPTSHRPGPLVGVMVAMLALMLCAWLVG